ncbi:protein of unknown function [Bradyrhizobium vignae]|uniref:Uncharacterized protein n=1 Tax=Bradyrhizobium vignae TaxID=1549949 RepID=A0A2U3PYV7_9BRAD|nr:protein of unknown function [Bradyrhizobium vignae]
MKQFWRKWTYEAPLAIGDALWGQLVPRIPDVASLQSATRPCVA